MKILIVEDEMIISEDIAMMLSDNGYEITDQVVDYDEAITAFQKDQPDLVLLDINLIGAKDGIDIASKLNELANIPFIYTSSLGDPLTIARAKETNPAAYLIKPFKEDQLLASIDIALTNFSKASIPSTPDEHLPIFNDAIFVKTNHRYTKVDLKDIRYIQKSDNYIDLHTPTKKHVIRGSIGSFLDQLSSNQFLRTHRSYAINVNYIQDVTPTFVLIGDIEVPLAKSFAPDLLKRLRIF